MEFQRVDKEYLLQSFRENREMLDRRNDENIEKYRKGDFALKLSGSNRKTVTVKQKKHKFLFGCTAFMLDSFESPEKEPIYREKFTRLFNQAVVPLYWSDLEPEEGKLRFSRDSVNIYRRPPVDTVLDFCSEYGIEPKGHCLLWNQFVPEWLAKYSTEERKKIVERRFSQIAAHYADKIPSFDVINESATNYHRGLAFLFEGYDEYALELGRKYFPNNIKIINEAMGAIWYYYHTCGKYIPFNMQLKEFLAKGHAIDEIGLQFHMFGKLTDYVKGRMSDGRKFDAFLNAPEHIEILDLFDAYGLPMHLSEITLPSYAGNLPENEAYQAELLREYYRIWFATKNMKSIVWWNLVDGYAAYAPQGTFEGENRYGGGLLRYDMSEKPAYKVLDHLINEEWNTSFTREVCGDTLSFRGFFGEYEITVEDEKGKKTTTVLLHSDKDTASV